MMSWLRYFVFNLDNLTTCCKHLKIPDYIHAVLKMCPNSFNGDRTISTVGCRCSFPTWSTCRNPPIPTKLMCTIIQTNGIIDMVLCFIALLILICNSNIMSTLYTHYAVIVTLWAYSNLMSIPTMLYYNTGRWNQAFWLVERRSRGVLYWAIMYCTAVYIYLSVPYQCALKIYYLS